MQHLDRQRPDRELVAILEQAVEVRAVRFQIIHREHGAEDFLHVADMRADPDPCACMRLDEGCGRQMIGMSVRLQHHRDPPVLLAGEGDDPLGRARVGDAARHVEVEDWIDHRRSPCRGIADEVANRIGRLVEKRLDEGLSHDFLR
jgi:hypothetical protein